MLREWFAGRSFRTPHNNGLEKPFSLCIMLAWVFWRLDEFANPVARREAVKEVG
jgi:hypothetical protein